MALKSPYGERGQLRTYWIVKLVILIFPRLNMHPTQFEAAYINPPKRTENTYTFPQALPYLSQYIFLMFRIILSGSVFIYSSIQSQH